MTGDADDGGTGEDSRERLADRRGVERAVYPPSEDSGLLAGAAVDAVEPDWRVLEVGTGSGWVAEKVRETTGAEVLGSDLNPVACEQARERGVPAVRANLVDPFEASVFDAVLFNPPYLPTPEGAEWDDWMERALSGGESGRDVVDPFLARVGRVLAPDGVVLLLVSSLTDVDAVREQATAEGFTAEEVAEESYPAERLVVLRLAAH
ncbi:methyltransferase [Halobacteriales archaeon QS_1_68_20]|nr:MAG: methyltransferase [Halobacteriales archaeon QS_1_68_20]